MCTSFGQLSSWYCCFECLWLCCCCGSSLSLLFFSLFEGWGFALRVYRRSALFLRFATRPMPQSRPPQQLPLKGSCTIGFIRVPLKGSLRATIRPILSVYLFVSVCAGALLGKVPCKGVYKDYYKGYYRGLV